MKKSFSEWIEFLYGPFFKVIGFFYRVYTANRARAESLKANELISSFIKFITVAIMLGWFLVWYFAPEESETSLIDAVKQSIGLDSPSDQ